MIKIIFFGTTNFSAHHLYALINCKKYQIQAIFTQSIKKSKDLSECSITKIAKYHSLWLFQSNILQTDKIISIIKKFKIDLIIIVSYGLILPKEIFTLPRLGCINVHGSLLPRWRGPSPIQRAIEHGDKTTGISIIQIDQGIDTGHIISFAKCNISPNDTSYTLSQKLAQIGSDLLLKTLNNLILGKHQIIPQNLTQSTYAYKLTKKEAQINWKLPAIKLERCIRAFNPWPISFFIIKNYYIRIWQAEVNNDDIYHHSNIPGTILKTCSTGIYVATGKNILILKKLQIQGKKINDVHDILNAYKKLFPLYSILK